MKVQLCGIILFLIGCSHPESQLKLTDLKFNDPFARQENDKEAVAANEIDTVFLICEQKGYCVWTSDTFGHCVYDKNGRILEYGKYCLFSELIKYEYDSIGFLKARDYSSDYVERIRATYRFVPDSLLLYQYWWDYQDTVLYYCFRYQFDNQGRVMELDRIDESSQTVSKTFYNYNPSGQLVYSKLDIYSDSIYEAEHSDYFYTNGILDSVITVMSQEYGGGFNKFYYNDKGLCYRMVRRGQGKRI